MAEEYEFNFDLERMKEAIKGEPIRIPYGVRGEQLKAYLREQLALREASKRQE